LHREGIDLIVALDTSRSMPATDVTEPPGARQAGSHGSRALCRATASAWSPSPAAPSSECPLTLDYAAFERSLRAIEVGIIPRGGTALARAIAFQPRRVRGARGQVQRPDLITDGGSRGDVRRRPSAPLRA
jgi:hypothetical protein